MQVNLAYGRRGLRVELPDDVDVIEPQHVASLPDERAAIEGALRQPIGCAPLRELVSSTDTVAIVFSDITRPMPNDRVLPVLLAELEHVARENIILINALGTHRANTADELVEMLGTDVVERYTILQHDAWDDDNLVDLGESRSGHRLTVNRRYLEASFRILTGFIEPHFFAGFSGGPKAVLPGIAGIESIMDNHGFELLNDERTTWGVTDGNPLWEEIREAADKTLPSFLLNVTLNAGRGITGVYAGAWQQAHARGAAFARERAMVPVDEPYDIVVTTNSGYPLDMNLYQAVKGMCCAAQVVRPGGSIVIAAECSEGVPNHGEYRAIVHEAGSLPALVATLGQPGYRRHDQWEAHMQARVMQRAEVYLYSDYLDDEETRKMLLEPCHDVGETVRALRRRYGEACRICVIPEGPQTIPYLRS